MPILEIDGVGRVEVDGSFDKMSPAKQDVIVKSIQQSSAAGKSSSEYEQPAPPPGVTIHSATGDQHVGNDGKLAPASPAETEARFMRQKRGMEMLLDSSDIAESGLHGVPFLGGLVPQAGAALKSLFGGSYDDELVRERAKRDTFATDYPKTSLAGQMVGGTLATLPLAGPLGNFIGGAATKLGALGRSAFVGAGFGGPDAAIRAEGGLADRAKAGAIGAATGATVGAVLPVVAKGVSMGAQKLADALRVKGQLRALGLTPESAKAVQRSLEADNTLGGAGNKSITAAGRNSMVADAGPNARQMLD